MKHVIFRPWSVEVLGSKLSQNLKEFKLRDSLRSLSWRRKEQRFRRAGSVPEEGRDMGGQKREDFDRDLEGASSCGRSLRE